MLSRGQGLPGTNHVRYLITKHHVMVTSLENIILRGIKALVGRIFEINSFMIDGTKSTFKNLESLSASSDVLGFVKTSSDIKITD